MGTFGNNSLPQNPFGWCGDLLYDGIGNLNARTGNTTAVAVAAVGTVLSAGAVYSIYNPNCRGATILFKPAAFPGSGSTTARVVITVNDPAGNSYQLAKFPAVSAASSNVYQIYPGLLPQYGVSASAANAVLPLNYNIGLSLSTGATSKEVTFSLSVMHLV